MKKTSLVIFLFILVFIISPLSAQTSGKIEAGDLGFTFFTGMLPEDYSYENYGNFFRETGIGITYQATSFLSVDPGIYIKTGDTDTKYKIGSGSISHQDNTNIGASLGLFYTVDMGPGFYTYIGPRFEYSISKYENEYVNGTKNNGDITAYSFALIIGFKYMLSNHFGFFADIGAGDHLSTGKYKSFDSGGTITGERKEQDRHFALAKGMLGVVFYLW